MTVAVRVIPCLDVDGGRVVKGVNFRGLRDAGDPVELAAFYDAEGADELTFLDITASSGGRDTMYDVVRRTAEQVFIPLTVGGGAHRPDQLQVEAGGGAVRVHRVQQDLPRAEPDAAARPVDGVHAGPDAPAVRGHLEAAGYAGGTGGRPPGR